MYMFMFMYMYMWMQVIDHPDRVAHDVHRPDLDERDHLEDLHMCMCMCMCMCACMCMCMCMCYVRVHAQIWTRDTTVRM